MIIVRIRLYGSSILTLFEDWLLLPATYWNYICILAAFNYSIPHSSLGLCSNMMVQSMQIKWDIHSVCLPFL